MTAFKKYVRTKGIKLESDYPFLPFDQDGPTIEGVTVNQETQTVKVYRVVVVEIYEFKRDGSVDFDFD